MFLFVVTYVYHYYDFILFSTAGTTNTYRLGSQRKPLYAQPPGLSTSPPRITPPIVPFSNLTLSTTVASSVAPSITMAVPQTSGMVTLTPTPLQYQFQSPVTAENQTPSSVVPPSFTNLVMNQLLCLQVQLHP
jgi:hypothetical protein